MTSNAEKEFLSKAQKEVQQRIKKENKELETLHVEEKELTDAIEGYSKFYDDLVKFLQESSNDFNIEIEDLPRYFKSNINEVYRNYVQIKQDALDEIQVLEKYIIKNKRDLNNTQRTLKFYRSQYMDSDFFEECLPLVEIYEEKISIYENNEKNSLLIIEKLKEILKKLKDWK
ncbi:hypothetical protein [Methanosphaera sp. BMS]|uniref:hypothetical protein n=1 Tax=Methanosphaera sp. BMS TaxID=1789762 RepID=UPI000DC1EAAB|nr:hypothetical protein [Methanosphaera sp. BMS]AWX32276.1 hypothetical protein AW729_03770 [Methanosphaera sp. BMS]